MMPKRRLALVLGTLSLLVCSCDKDKKVPVFAVRGQVRFNGQPVPQAFVVFHPQGLDSAELVRPTSRTDKDGYFTLSTYTADDGAPAGDYVVTVEWRPLVKGLSGDPEPGPNRLPDRYHSPATSPLHVQIVEGPNDLQPLDVTP